MTAAASSGVSILGQGSGSDKGVGRGEEACSTSPPQESGRDPGRDWASHAPTTHAWESQRWVGPGPGPFPGQGLALWVQAGASGFSGPQT